MANLMAIGEMHVKITVGNISHPLGVHKNVTATHKVKITYTFINRISI